MKGWLTMSSLFNKEDEDKLLPPGPVPFPVCVCFGDGRLKQTWGPSSPMSFPSAFVFLTMEDWEEPSPWLFLFLSLSAGKRPIWEIRLDLQEEFYQLSQD